MGILTKFFGGHPQPSLDSVSFDDSRYSYQGVRDGAKVWHTQDGDGTGLFFFPLKPDLPSGLVTLTQLRDSYASKLDRSFSVIECRVQPLDEVPGIWLLIKGFGPEGRGSVYIGSLTIPFRDFSYVIKMQCRERGTTGMREALLVAKALENGTGSIQNEKFVPQGWSIEDEQFDDLLSQHPLSRLRREFRHIAKSVRIEAAIKRSAPFGLPQNDT